MIQDLFDKVKKIETNQQLFEAAKKRYRLGNPPGKDKVTIGDQINWEALLAEVPDGEDLIVISGDQDYCSAINKDAINQFLLEEWREKKKSQIVFFKSLSAFLKVKIPEIKLNDERQTTKLIEQLAQSGSFATTHAVIASLSKFVDFPQNQVEDLVKIAELNNQVGWIIGDDDVFDFYQVILNKYGDALNPKLKESLEGIMRQAKSELDDANDDELPF